MKTKTIVGLVLIALVIVWFIIGTIRCIKSERKGWNNGICPDCGEKLRHFDTDSQGGHGWCCDKCNYVTWVSWKRFIYKNNR